MNDMTITFHTAYPNTPATLTFQGLTTNLVTTPNGDLFYLEAPNGTHPYTVVINGITYSGSISIQNNTGYVDVTAPPPPTIPWWLIAVGLIGAVAVGYYVLKGRKK